MIARVILGTAIIYVSVAALGAAAGVFLGSAVWVMQTMGVI